MRDKKTTHHVTYNAIYANPIQHYIPKNTHTMEQKSFPNKKKKTKKQKTKNKNLKPYLLHSLKHNKACIIRIFIYFFNNIYFYTYFQAYIFSCFSVYLSNTLRTSPINALYLFFRA